MAYSLELERRIDVAAGELDLRFKKKKMFGGLAYFAKGGNMAFAIRGNELLFRVNGGETDELLRLDGMHTAIMGDRLMHDWLQAGGEAIKDAADLIELLTIGYDYALSLPPKHTP
ncbi:MAG TPA: TfoX/Sxy family protein [Verrucomicrobiae bacterium]|nr:TfoX/Sxy family protein [Verrucomicrobiae bacterium]